MAAPREPPLVVVSRPAARIGEALEALEARGLAALAAPLLEPVAQSTPAFAQFCRDLQANRIDTVVFTSPYGLPLAARLADAAGVEEFHDLLRARHVVAIGPRTAQALAEGGLRAGSVAAEHTSRGVAAELGPRCAGQHVALLRSARGDPRLAADLAAAGAEVLDVPVYDLARPAPTPEHRAVAEAVRLGRVRAYAFTSPLTVQRFLDWMREEGLEEAARASLHGAVVAAIGPPTAQACREAGFSHVRTAPEATFPALADEVDRALKGS